MINLTKDKWKKSLLRECCTFTRGVIYSNNDEVNYGGFGILRANNIDLNNNINFQDIKRISSNLMIKEEKRLGKNDIFICTASGSIEHIGKVAFINADTDCYAGGFMGIIRAKVDLINSYFLFIVFTSPLFVNLLKSQRAGTNIQNLKFSDIENNEIPLPPLDEQQRLVELFQSIEQSIVHMQEQEGNFRKLAKRLIDGFVSEKPIFGKLLRGKKLKKVKYCEVVNKLARRIDPVSYGIERIVAGEHLASGDFKIREWGTVGKDFLGPAFHMLFQSGDILYGSRRTYLKKVALADFEGVCANTTYVLRADENYLLQNLLKHIMLSEKFTQYSIGVSKGSTNPYINWKDLDNFAFDIPNLKTQREMANVLDNIIAIAEQFRTQIQTMKTLKQKLLNEILGG